MSMFHKIINALDKISVVVFIWCMSYMGYTKGKYVLSAIILIFSFVLLVVLLKHYKNKPFGNKVMDVFVILMSFWGFVNYESPMYLGVTLITVGIIDLVYFLYIDYCCIRQKLQSKDTQKQSEYQEYIDSEKE